MSGGEMVNKEKIKKWKKEEEKETGDRHATRGYAAYVSSGSPSPIPIPIPIPTNPAAFFLYDRYYSNAIIIFPGFVPFCRII